MSQRQRLIAAVQLCCTSSRPALSDSLRSAATQWHSSSDPACCSRAVSLQRWSARAFSSQASTTPSSGHAPTSTSQAPASIADDVALTATVLEQVGVHQLREELEDEAQKQLYIPYKDFVARAKACGAAHTDQEAEELCRSLQKVGIVLRYQNIVYLQADDICEMVMTLLPGGKEDAEAKLARVEAELSSLDGLHKQAVRSAHRTTDFILGMGGCILFLQLVGFIYLTWWELSWDVMEPFGYVIQLFYSFIAYVYFMSTRGKVFDLGPFREFWSERFKKQTIQKAKFDVQRYEYLLRLRDRYKRHLQYIPVWDAGSAWRGRERGHHSRA